MPHIALMLYPGRSPALQERLARALQTCLLQEGNWTAADISVSVESIAPERFAQEVGSRIHPAELLIPSDYIAYMD